MRIPSYRLTHHDFISFIRLYCYNDGLPAAPEETYIDAGLGQWAQLLAAWRAKCIPSNASIVLFSRLIGDAYCSL